MKSIIVGTAGHIDHGKLRRMRGVSAAGDPGTRVFCVTGWTAGAARRNPEPREGTPAGGSSK